MAVSQEPTSLRGGLFPYRRVSRSYRPLSRKRLEDAFWKIRPEGDRVLDRNGSMACPISVRTIQAESSGLWKGRASF